MKKVFLGSTETLLLAFLFAHASLAPAQQPPQPAPRAAANQPASPEEAKRRTEEAAEEKAPGQGEAKPAAAKETQQPRQETKKP